MICIATVSIAALSAMKMIDAAERNVVDDGVVAELE